jgi:hypothetical protein
MPGGGIGKFGGKPPGGGGRFAPPGMLGTGGGKPPWGGVPVAPAGKGGGNGRPPGAVWLKRILLVGCRPCFHEAYACLWMDLRGGIPGAPGAPGGGRPGRPKGGGGPWPG